MNESSTNEEKMIQIGNLLAKDIAALQANRKKVVLTYDSPHLPLDARNCITKPELCTMDESKLFDRQPYLSLFDDHLNKINNICIFRQSKLFMNGNQFNGTDSTGRILFRDNHHLGYFGSDEMAKLFRISNCNTYKI